MVAILAFSSVRPISTRRQLTRIALCNTSIGAPRGSILAWKARQYWGLAILCGLAYKLCTHDCPSNFRAVNGVAVNSSRLCP